MTADSGDISIITLSALYEERPDSMLRLSSRYGAGRETRTPNRLITGQLHYQLCYTSIYERNRLESNQQCYHNQERSRTFMSYNLTLPF